MLMAVEHTLSEGHFTVHLRKMGTKITFGTTFPHRHPVYRRSKKDQEEEPKLVFEREKQELPRGSRTPSATAFCPPPP